MSVDREALREAVARAECRRKYLIWAKRWHGFAAPTEEDTEFVVNRDWREQLPSADAAIAVIIRACQEAAMPPPLSDPATPDYMADFRYRAGRLNAVEALSVFLPGGKTDG